MPGRSQNVVPGGLLFVFSARSPTTSGSTVTAPAGAFTGPAAGLAHTRATDVAGAAVGFGRAPGALSQPVTDSRASASGAAAHARCRLVDVTRPPGR
ncbi:hypothetical protein GCM10010384_35280 [Streptomyces djakartensis]|uniref:Uncharacterized protein n=1 Tax=Streptomyces djakartensis TaxID=68193 RepID=A0ABQ2ZTQ0_9ACTN|nr:hypothetical protein GCM10010384_35280 [Streptomyces djakartensis]